MDRHTSRKYRRIWLLMLIILTAPASWAADEVVIKMATIAPQNSEWHQVLQEMGAEWEHASRGQVKFRLYPGGVAGDDSDVVRKMRLGTLSAALLSSDGLTDIDRSVLALQVPLAYANYRELDCTIEQLGPPIEKQLDARGFVLLGWSDAGWAHFFTKSPVRTPDDMKKLKMFVWAGDDRYVELWKKAGFNPVPLPSTEISTALQTGLVNAVTSTPQGAVLLQWYRQVKYMSDLKWAVLLGAIVVNKPTWEKIPADVRPLLKEAARNACRRLSQFSRQSESRDIEVLQKHGVHVVVVDDAVLAQWRQIIDEVLPQVRGSFLPAESLDAALKRRDQCRQQAGKAGGS
ncbi:MAG: TRAP transporter substrate-binding protein DctP [Proteobacteria bacterium]|nr:TRAP transporter substrate-binding protein DctP [Pseudomonadota bacterium]